VVDRPELIPLRAGNLAGEECIIFAYFDGKVDFMPVKPQATSANARCPCPGALD